MLAPSHTLSPHPQYLSEPVELLSPLFILRDENTRRVLVASKPHVQGINVFFGKFYVILDIFKLRKKQMKFRLEGIKKLTSFAVL